MARFLSVPLAILSNMCSVRKVHRSARIALRTTPALHSGGPFGYLDRARVVLWATLGNMVGGIGLVTVLRLAQVGRRTMKEEEDKAGDPH